VLVSRILSFLAARENAWLLVLGLGPITMTLLLGISGLMKITPNYFIPTAYIVPLLIVKAVGPPVTPARVRAVMAAAAAFLLLALAISPIVAYASVALRLDQMQQVSRDVAAAATKVWHSAVAAPLRIATGTEAFSLALPFYSPDNPAEFTHYNF